MTKKQDFLRSQQSRDKHPDSGMVGSASEVERRGAASTNVDVTMEDKQAAQSGKVENDHNKQGQQPPTQKNEGRRTPESRHDRQNTPARTTTSRRARAARGAGSPRGAG